MKLQVNGIYLNIPDKYKCELSARVKCEKSFIMYVRLGDVEFMDLDGTDRMRRLALSIGKVRLALGVLYLYEKGKWIVIQNYQQLASALSVRTRKDYKEQIRRDAIRERRSITKIQTDLKRERDYSVYSDAIRRHKAPKPHRDCDGKYSTGDGTYIAELRFGTYVKAVYRRKF